MVHWVFIVHALFVLSSVASFSHSHKYSVPEGFPLAVQLAVMLVSVTLENAAGPGLLANVNA
jgi:hypothetical protein